jgi:hypothetical protein
MNEIPCIECAVCKKRVEKTVTWYDKLADVRVIQVECHGARDEMRIDGVVFLSLTPEMMRQLRNGVGVAFQTARIGSSLPPAPSPEV